MVGLLAAVVLAGGCGAGCSGSTGGSGGDPRGPAGQPPSATVTAEQAGDRAAAVYSAVIRHHLVSVTDGVPSLVHVLDRAVPDAGDPMRTLGDEDGVVIDPRVRDRLVSELADLAVVDFVAGGQAVLDRDASGCPIVRDHGALITVAPVPAAGDRVEIGLADFRTCLSGRWQTYVLTRAGNAWSVQGTTGPVAVS